MKTIKVVAAVICDNMKEKNKIFATARGYGELKGGWEFPGGKIEAGETPQEALKREIMEELDTEIKVGDQCGQLKPRMLKIQRFWAYILDFLYKYLDISS
ncbi:MAG: NUDIX domain-containing protein [Longicatena caecimuris]|uniref:NUDIX domain-containing protein n=1 Tax=Longicatena caecimuris TaxID=1796635 RepID=UPI0039925FD3